MYYIFEPRLNFKKEVALSGEFEIEMVMNRIVIKTEQRIDENKLDQIKSKISQIFFDKMKLSNIEVNLINVIE